MIASAQASAASRKDTVTAGPAKLPAARAPTEKMPAPTATATPRIIRSHAVSERLSSRPGSDASAMVCSIDLVRSRLGRKLVLRLGEGGIGGSRDGGECAAPPGYPAQRAMQATPGGDVAHLRHLRDSPHPGPPWICNKHESRDNRYRCRYRKSAVPSPPWFVRARLKTRQLMLMIAIEEQGNIHRAAETLNMSQPAASTLLKDLQELIA